VRNTGIQIRSLSN